MVNIILKNTTMGVKEQEYWELVREQLATFGVDGVSLLNTKIHKKLFIGSGKIQNHVISRIFNKMSK